MTKLLWKSNLGENYNTITHQILALLQRDDRLTVREIQAALKISTPSLVAHHLRKLRAAGAIVWEPRKARSIRIINRG